MTTQLSKLIVLTMVAGLAACSSPQQTEDETPAAKEISEAKEAAETEANKAPKPNADWGYGDENGPDQWGTLSPEFAMCDLGKNQSPVDFVDTVEVPDLPSPTVMYTRGPSELVHKGYALQANYPEGNKITVGGQDYALLQLHFHTPSEHAVSGEEYPLEGHFVHADADGNLAVIGVFFEEGEANEDLGALIENAPAEKGETASMKRSSFKTAGLLPTARDHYRYNGSLTTPPCSEGVRFFIMNEPVSASADQIDALHQAVGHHNARPVQPTNARIIAE